MTTNTEQVNAGKLNLLLTLVKRAVSLAIVTSEPGVFKKPETSDELATQNRNIDDIVANKFRKHFGI